MKMYIKQLVVVFVIAIFNCLLYGQANYKTSNIWYFGQNAGLDFNSGTFPPTSLDDSKMNTGEGCASITDNNGSLLFYSDGINIWDRTHSKMPNANGTVYPVDWDKMLSGDYSSTQSVIITPVIGGVQRYYIFTTDGGSTSSSIGPKGEWDGLYYTIVDMSLNNGLGDIDTSFIRSLGYSGNKIPLADSIAEKVTAVRHANGLDYWIITQKHFTSDFYAFKVSCQGIDHIPVITLASSLGIFDTVPSRGGCITASNNGKKLSLAYYTILAPGPFVWLCDFDNNVGMMTNVDTIYTRGNTYSTCFSSNDSILYIPSWDHIIRYDCYNSTIMDSVLTGPTYDLKRGPDNRIYLKSNGTKLSVFHTPNNYTNAGFDLASVPLKSNTIVLAALPSVYNFTTVEKKSNSILNICKEDSIKIGFDYDFEVGYSINWTPISSLDSPNIENPLAFPQVTTKYLATIITPCDTLYDSVTVNVVDTFPVVNLGPDTTVCEGEAILLYAGNYNSYLWSTGDTSASVLLNITNSITINVEVSNICYIATDTVDIIKLDMPEIDLGADIYICLGDTVNIDAGDQTSFIWSTGATTSGITISSFGMYNVIVTNEEGCTAKDSISIKEDECGDIKSEEQYSIFVPNVFSPNGDGINDLLIYSFEHINELISMKVYNRLGMVIFETKDLNEFWDGTYKNSLQARDIYTYELFVLTSNEQVVNLMGNISLIY